MFICVISGCIYVLCLFLLITESYFLRMRHVIAGCYEPHREKQRTVYLYNHILQNRTGFLSMLWRKARAAVGDKRRMEEVSCATKMAAS